MSDILVRICVGLCGLVCAGVAVHATSGAPRGSRWFEIAVLFIAGLITILRALGVL
jgi:hypothetical protein